MSKKKKTRNERTTKTHNFSHLKKNSRQKQEAITEGSPETVGETRSLLDPIYIYDLKRVLFFIGLIVVIILIMTYLVYRTNAFNFIFNKYGINY
jgi:uncharacterized membrane protein